MFNGGKINKYKNDHLLCCIVITSTQCSHRTIIEKLNKDIKKQTLFEERSSILFFVNATLKY